MERHWTLDDIPWARFDRALVDAGILCAMKAAALVEHNSGDYVVYLCNVFAGDAEFQAAARAWGEEEVQHGRALARWAALADPAFDLGAALQNFTANFRLPLSDQASVRGSHAGELVARCVVEVGTSSFYSAVPRSKAGSASAAQRAKARPCWTSSSPQARAAAWNSGSSAKTLQR